VPVSE